MHADLPHRTRLSHQLFSRFRRLSSSTLACSIPRKANPQLQFGFYTTTLLPKLAEAGRGEAKVLEIDLLFLPPYSSNLNLIERLWKLTKRRCLTNRYYPHFEAFCGAIEKCLEDLSGPLKKEHTSLITLNFQFFKNHNF